MKFLICTQHLKNTVSYILKHTAVESIISYMLGNKTVSYHDYIFVYSLYVGSVTTLYIYSFCLA